MALVTSPTPNVSNMTCGTVIPTQAQLMSVDTWMGMMGASWAANALTECSVDASWKNASEGCGMCCGITEKHDGRIKWHTRAVRSKFEPRLWPDADPHVFANLSHSNRPESNRHFSTTRLVAASSLWASTVFRTYPTVKLLFWRYYELLALRSERHC